MDDLKQKFEALGHGPDEFSALVESAKKDERDGLTLYLKMRGVFSPSVTEGAHMAALRTALIDYVLRWNLDARATLPGLADIAIQVIEVSQKEKPDA